MMWKRFNTRNQILILLRSVKCKKMDVYKHGKLSLDFVRKIKIITPSHSADVCLPKSVGDSLDQVSN